MSKHTKQVTAGFLGILVVVVLALAAIGGTVYVANRTERQADESIKDESKMEVTVDLDSKTSLKALVALGTPLRCEVSQGTEAAMTNGVVFINGGKVRGDFSSQVNGSGSVASHMLVDGQTVYAWSDMSAQGFKTSVNANADASAEATAPSYNQQLDYRCTAWNPEASRFELPAGMTFMDINVAGAAAAGATFQAGDACSSCDVLPDGAAKTACQYRMGCGN